MEILSIQLDHYKKFNANNIKSFNASFINPTVIILGTNGSGKSSLISELIPTADKSNIFSSKEGFKEIVLTHEGKQYTLQTKAVSSKVVEHLFYCEDEQLNQNKLFSTQQELIFSHFGLSDNIAKLLSNSIKMTMLTSSTRRGFFSKINPNDLSYLLKKYKDIYSLRKDTEANIKHLYSRKAELENELINEEELKGYLVKISDLEESRSKLTLSYDLSTYELNKLPIYDTYIDIQNKESIYLTLFQISELMKKANVTIKTVESTKLILETDLNKLSGTSNSLLNEYRLLSDEVNSLKKNIQNDDTLIETVKLEIDKITDQLNTTYSRFKNTSFVPLRDTTVTNFYTSLKNIQTYIEQIEHQRALEPELFKEYSFENSYLHDSTMLENEYYIIMRDISNEEEKLNDINKRIQDHERIVVPESCKLNNRSKCSLYTSYKDAHDKDVIIHKNISDNINVLRDRLSILSNELITKRKLRDMDSVIKACIQNITDILIREGILVSIESIKKQPFDIVQMVLNHSYDIVTFSQEVFELTKSYNEYCQLTDELNKHVSKLESTDNSVSRVYLQTLIDRHESKLISIENELNTISSSQKDIKKRLEIINLLLDKISDWNTLSKVYLDYEIQLTEILKRFYYTTVIKKLTEDINDINTQINHVNNIITHQNGIKLRLDKEVTEVVNKLNDEILIIKAVEKELATLNYIYNLTFIRNILNNVNNILRKIFTYSIEISNPILNKITIDDLTTIESIQNIDEVFNFNVMIDGSTLVPDISECSTGQMNMINLAFNIALLIELGISHYPIFLDEIDSGLDNTHRNQLFLFLQDLIDERIVEQIFLVSNTYFHDSFLGQTIVLSDTNITVPENYNDEVTIVKYVI